MSIVWCVDSIGLWCYQHWIIPRSKRREKESSDKKKRRWKESNVVSLVFLVHHECTRVWCMKNRWKCGWEGSDGGRVEGKEERAEEKWRKKGKGKKVVLGESPFCFCLTVCLPLPFFPHPSRQNTLTLTHNIPYNTTHWCTPSHANRAGCCAAFFGSG